MAKKITELTELAAQPATGDLIIIEDVSASTTKKITWDNFIADGAITPVKRSGGFNIGTFTITGNGTKAVTGVGFTPKLVRFTLGGSDDDGTVFEAVFGAMDGTTQFAKGMHGAEGSGDVSGVFVTDAAIFRMRANAATDNKAAFSSFDADGFTLTVTDYQANTVVYYEAYG